ncbi:hypothetical protein BZA77DRAFT_364773 [Pyronema omphalodes]|nr:hypothetical protein BZA77DRAFT_364773 [Pyronema omphalodes]
MQIICDIRSTASSKVGITRAGSPEPPQNHGSQQRRHAFLFRNSRAGAWLATVCSRLFSYINLRHTRPNMSLTINAVYTSPNDTNTFVIPVEAAAATEESSQADQTNHVKAVREAVTKLQDQVNKYLTERMEVEKNDAAKALEDNYGEEIVDEE